MNGALVKALMKSAVYLGISELLLKGGSGERRVKNMVVGGIFMLLAGSVGFIAIVGTLLTIFFLLSGQGDLVRPTVIVVLIAAAITLLLFWEGVRRMRNRLTTRKEVIRYG